MGQLDEEENSDKALREQFKERWTRTPSDKLTTPIRTEGNKYKQIIDKAIQADHVVKERYQKHKESIELLSKPPVREFFDISDPELFCCDIIWHFIVW